MSIYTKTILLILFLLFNVILRGQDVDSVQTLYMVDGSFLLGTLVEETTTHHVWQLTDGTQIEIPSTQIKKLKAQRLDFKHIKKGKIQRVEGFYGSLVVGGLFKKYQNDYYNRDVDATANLSVGYHLNSKISVGIGTGYDFYADIPVVPIFAEIRGNIFDKVITPYYKIAAGYGITRPKDYFNGVNISGGILVHPSVGLKFHTRSNVAWTLDFGYRFQRYDIKYSIDTNPQRWTYRRASLRAGLEF